MVLSNRDCRERVYTDEERRVAKLTMNTKTVIVAIDITANDVARFHRNLKPS